MQRSECINVINRLAADGVPFVFIISYDAADCRVWPAGSVPDGVFYNLNGVGNDASMRPAAHHGSIRWNVKAEDESSYKRRFDIVQRHLRLGDTYLVNLTSRTEVDTDLTMADIYRLSEAKYKIFVRDEFVCFSPETFLQIRNGTISCCPMKGTIPASVPGAEQTLMADRKEAAEHATIVDLIRNDLSMVAGHVTVEKYRYVERLHTNKGDILQTSSRITGRLPRSFERHLGNIIFSQLPAGSITGAPKPMTCRIISEAEDYRRGFYTGVMGYWHDGTLDSAVMIRFIDTDGRRLWFKAGGGITAMSDCRSEYLETIEKIYVPITSF